MAAIADLEKYLNDTFAKNAPALPANTKQFIVKYAPWLSLAIGVLSILSALSLWHWANAANKIVDYANSMNAMYGSSAAIVDRLTPAVWIGLIVLLVEGALYLAAFTGLRDRKKSGWNLLLYALLVNVIYGVAIMFTSYGSIGSFVLSLIGTAAGLYFLFQIRSFYDVTATAQPRKTVVAKSSEAPKK